MSKDIIWKKEEIKQLIIINQYKKWWISILWQKKKDIKEHNSNWPEIPDPPYKILIIGGSGYGKTNELLNLINHEADIDKIYYMLKICMKQNINY